MSQILLSLGEALEQIEYGKAIISLGEPDIGRIMSVDKEGWIYAVDSFKKYKKYNLNFKVEKEPCKHWIIFEVNEKLQDVLDNLPEVL